MTAVGFILFVVGFFGAFKWGSKRVDIWNGADYIFVPIAGTGLVLVVMGLLGSITLWLWKVAI